MSVGIIYHPQSNGYFFYLYSKKTIKKERSVTHLYDVTLTYAVRVHIVKEHCPQIKCHVCQTSLYI